MKLNARPLIEMALCIGILGSCIEIADYALALLDFDYCLIYQL
jgi:hypothetical protein